MNKNRIRYTIFFCLVSFTVLAQQDSVLLKSDAFQIRCNKYGLSGISKVNDTFPTNYIGKGKLLGEVVARYRTENDFDSSFSADGSTTFFQNGKQVSQYSAATKKKEIEVNQLFDLHGSKLGWTIRITNSSSHNITVEDLAVPFFYNNEEVENSKEIFEQRIIEHQFISGSNSFLFWQRPSGVAPYLVMVPSPGTSLEYFKTEAFHNSEPVYQAFVHSAYTRGQATGSWRQPFTSLALAAHTSKEYGFNFRWANSYDDIRNILVEEGLIDVHIAPGMTIPTDLNAMIALRTKEKITHIDAEFPQQTILTSAGEKKKGTHIYQVTFSHLGENKLTVHYGENKTTYLEFFVTEPLQTLYKKRAAFIVSHQQHKDSTKWYDGLFSVWDMKDSILRGPDNDDGFNKSRLTYLLTCDDPALCKAPFVAAKNVVYPDQKEIDAVEYYIKHYVWGRLQRTDKETNPYGVYGTPNWLAGRDSVKRAANRNDPNRNKMHIWRSYDYPHIMMMYYHLYQIASLYPGMTHYLNKRGYLIRAKETAKAYFTYPYQILPWYETYKWGCYNELLIPDLIADLKKEGYGEDANWLTKEWEKKVKYFIYDDPYPFRSEYAVDATAYESTEAFADYALQHNMQPDTLLWYDKNLNKWYSHPTITKHDAKRFMEAQMQANIACRGWLEPAYYYMGSDFRGKSDSYLLSYMAQMGGWAVLDYGLHYASHAADYIQLGYASYLSSFALMNTGTPQSSYGFWYSGKDNDGATGWAFEPQQNKTTWIQKPQGRGPWYYDGEIDLGYGGATRTAATVIVKDSLFGWMAYGGTLRRENNTINVVPKDGLQKRLYYRVDNKKIDIELNRDGFADGKNVCIDTTTHTIQFYLENRTSDAHQTSITIKGLQGKYRVDLNNKQVRTFALLMQGTDIELPVAADDKFAFVSIKPAR